MNRYTLAIRLKRYLIRQTIAGLVAGLAVSCVLLAGSEVWAQPVPMPMPQPGPTYIEALKKEPDSQRLFRLESDEMLRQRMAREGKTKWNPLDLEYEYVSPDYPKPREPQPVVRDWEQMAAITEPGFVCYNRLYFEQLNMERYGWSFGVASPLISLGAFFCDVATLPYHAAQQPCQRHECDAGYCLPGDRVPLMLYYPTPSLTGALAEAATIGLLFVAFP